MSFPLVDIRIKDPFSHISPLFRAFRCLCVIEVEGNGILIAQSRLNSLRPFVTVRLRWGVCCGGRSQP